MDVIVSGWLYKSPPERKLWNPFKQAWQRRFFVLTHEFKKDRLDLNYYDSEDRMNKKGSIDLERCVNIRMEADDTKTSSSVTHLLNEQHPFKYIFSLKTKQRSRDRMYLLGSEALESVDTWMQCLRTVLSKKPHIPPSEEPGLEDCQPFLNSSKRPKSSDGHRHASGREQRHAPGKEHSYTRWASFHASKDGKSHKKGQPASNRSVNNIDNMNNLNNIDNMNNLNFDFKNKCQQNVSSHQQKQHTHTKKLAHHLHLGQQLLYDHPQEFDYIIPVEEDGLHDNGLHDNGLHDDSNQSYVLLDQCFSGYQGQQNNNNMNNNCNDATQETNKYYNTASDDNIFLSSKSNNPRIKHKQLLHNNNTMRKARFHVESGSCSNLPTNRKQQHNSVGDHFSYVDNINNKNHNNKNNNNNNKNHNNNNNNNNNNISNVQMGNNLEYKPPRGHLKIMMPHGNLDNNNNKRMHNIGSRSQVLSRKSLQQAKTRQQYSTTRQQHNANSLMAFNNKSDSQMNNNHIRNKNVGGSGVFFTLPPKPGMEQRRSEESYAWYQRQFLARSNLCISDASPDSNNDDDGGDDDDDYDEDSSPFTESSDCPCKYHHCECVYPNQYSLPPSRQQPRPHYDEHNIEDHPNKAYYNQHSLQYLELDLERCHLNTQQQPQLNTQQQPQLNTQQPQQQRLNIQQPQPTTQQPQQNIQHSNRSNKHNLNNNNTFFTNNSGTQYTQIDINKTRGLQDTKFHLENERRNSDKNMDFPNKNSTNNFKLPADAKNTFYLPANNANNDNLSVLYGNKNKKGRSAMLLSRGSYSNISAKKNKKSYSSTVF